MKPFFLLLLISSLSTSFASAACKITAPAGRALANQDLLAALLKKAQACPQDVLALREALAADGLKLIPTMVANQGFHNSTAGSFSLFEMVEGNSRAAGRFVKAGDFFFGHFTEADGQTLHLAQAPSAGALMVEFIAWDASKGLYNFYELIGTGQSGAWFYRGDSADIAADVQLLHLQPNPAAPAFGGRLRCSGCHVNGGPIMKELALPHNDWWMPERKLPLAQAPDAAMAEILKSLAPASALANAVEIGSSQLALTPREISLPEKLRPLFCPVELNLESSPSLADQKDGEIHLPASFFLDSQLATGPLPALASDYQEALGILSFRFPETKRADGDHAFLGPVKAGSDEILVDQLVKTGVIDQHFRLAILSVDKTNPVFSAGRCGLLRMIPSMAQAGWKKEFLGKLRDASAKNPAAAEAFRNLSDPARSSAALKAEGAAFLAACQAKLKEGSLEPYLKLLAQRRAEAAASEISKNPKGQILEPGFRVIFPAPAHPALPGKLHLNEACEVEGA